MNEQVLIEARKKLAGFLKERREELGLTQLQLANKCNWKQQTIQRIESANHFISTKQLWILCNALELYWFIETKEGDSPGAEMMRNKFTGGTPPSMN